MPVQSAVVFLPRVAVEPLPAAAVTVPTVAPEAVEAVSVEDDAMVATWPDDTAESEFRADARERGEPVRVALEAEDAVDEPDENALPKLDELVARIPAGVREALEDLFRARFVAVKRVPKKVLKP